MVSGFSFEFVRGFTKTGMWAHKKLQQINRIWDLNRKM